MDSKELEVKILNINIEEIHNKLLKLKADYLGEIKQKIYTYDCYEPILMYNLAVEDYKINKNKYSKNKISNIFSQYSIVLTEEENNYIKKLTKYNSLVEYLKKDEIDINILLDKKLLEIIKESNNRFFKWIRLRESNEQIELTIKYIYNVNKEYNIDDVREIEINVNSFEVANTLLEEMGYYKKKLVEKNRKSYKLNNLEIVIDMWPLINPYIEIEGKNEQEIYDMVEKLGFNKTDTKIMNTDDVYKDEGIILDEYLVLTFNEQVKI